MAAEVIRLLHPYSITYEFRYTKMGSKTLAKLHEVREAAKMLLEAARPVCVATIGGPTPDDITDPGGVGF